MHTNYQKLEDGYQKTEPAEPTEPGKGWSGIRESVCLRKLDILLTLINLAMLAWIQFFMLAQTRAYQNMVDTLAETLVKTKAVQEVYQFELGG